MSRRLALLFVLLGFALTLPASAAETARPGRQGGGVTLLPNGWRIAPAGRHIPVGDLPLAMAESPDGARLVVSNNGYSKPSLSVVDPQRFTVPATVPLENAWLGLAWHPDGKRLWVSGGGANTVQELKVTDKGLEPGAVVQLKKVSDESFVGGLSISPDGSRLFAVHALGKLLSAVDLAAGKVVKEAELPAEGYTTLVSADGKTVYVSLWGGAKVLLFDAETLAPSGEIAVGEHPNAMAFSKDGGRLFVACANTNEVWVADLATRTAKERISIALDPAAPPGSTPNGLGLSPDGKTLLVADADN
ncbi:MAG TPA: LpqB family beta-propeller domain-containing protein, partial [Thermoanaerobaculia bacterium]